MNDVTKLLQQATDGDKTAENELLLLVHDELRRMAAAKLARENPGHTLQTTALINEAYLRLLGREPKSAKTKSNDEQSVLGQWDSRAHFFGAAAEAMRRILIDNVIAGSEIMGIDNQRNSAASDRWEECNEVTVIELAGFTCQFLVDGDIGMKWSELKILRRVFNGLFQISNACALFEN